MANTDRKKQNHATNPNYWLRIPGESTVCRPRFFGGYQYGPANKDFDYYCRGQETKNK